MNLDVEIIPFENCYGDFVRKLLNETWKQTVNYPYNEKLIRIGTSEIPSAYIVVSKNKPIGFLSLWKNSFHPHSLYFIIIIDRRYRKKGIGSFVFQYLQTLNIDLKKLQCSIYENSFAGDIFLKKIGFKLYRETIESRISSSIDSISQLNEVESFKTTIKSIDEGIPENEFADFLKLVKYVYSESHRDNPPGDFAIETWENLVNIGLIKSGSYLINFEGKVIAFALLHESDESSYDLGWRGISPDFDLHRSFLIKTLTTRQLVYAKQNNVEWLNVEIDSTDRCSMSILNEFQFNIGAKWLSYQKSYD